MPDWEKQADFEPGGETLEGSSTSRRPDAVSLDYLRAFTLGPVALQDPDEGVFDYVWRVRVDNSAGEVHLARENDAGDGWKADSLLFTFSGADIEEVDVAFDQNGNTVLVAERATGSGGAAELWIRFFDPTLGAQDFSSYGPGRTPRALLDAPRQPQRSDVLAFYFNDDTDALEYRVQNDRYQTANATGLTGAAGLSVEDLAKAVDSRLQVIYSDRDASAGTYSLDRLVSVLYPIPAQTEAFQPTHLFLAATLNQVVQRFSNQPVEAYRPVHEVVAATVNDIARRLTDQDVEAFRPVHEIVAATLADLAIRALDQPPEAYRPVHEIIAATLEEVIIRLESQPVEAFRPTHEVVNVVLAGPLPVTTGLVLDLDGRTLSGADGSDVTAWQEQSGQGNDPTIQAGEEPSLRVGITPGGKNAVRFTEASTERLLLPDLGISGAGNRTVFAVAQFVTATENSLLSINADNDSINGERWTFRQDGASGALRIELHGSAYITSLDPAGGWGVMMCMLAGTTLADHILRLDATEEAATGNNAVQTVDTNYQVGQYFGMFWADMLLGRLLVYDRDLSSAERDSVQANLDANHL